jgi:hypothetical protein
MPGEALVVNSNQVVHETIEDEVILIQLERANYYSLAGSGKEIWEMICAGIAPAAILERMEAAYQQENGEVAADLERLITQLREEGLVQDAPAEAAHASSNGTPADHTFEPAGGRYVPAKLEKYTDMQDFLLVDPIHDVAPEGWPTLDRGE